MAKISKKDFPKVGNRIKQIRFTKSMDQPAFGEMFDPPASASNVSRWERGINLPSDNRLKQVAKLGGVSVDYLLHGTQNIDPIHLYDIIEKDNKHETTTKEEKTLLNEASLEGKVHQDTLLGIHEKEFIANVNYLISNNFDNKQQLYLSTILNFSFSYLFKQNNDHVDDFRKVFSGLQDLMEPKYSGPKSELRKNIKNYFNDLLNSLN